MGFLHTSLMWLFLPLVAVPIILHLITIRRLRTVELSTFRFLFDSYVQQRRRMKFLEALIALLRTIFLLFVVFAVARPVIRHWDQLFGGGASGRDVVLLMDVSASMGTVTDGLSALDRAKLGAAEVVKQLGGDDRVTVIRVGARPQEICNRFSADAKAIQQELDNLKVGPARANLFAAFSHLFGPESPALQTPRVYLFGDLQTSGWSEFQEGASGSLIPDDAEIILVNVGSQQATDNFAVSAASLDDEQLVVGLPVTLRPQIKSYSQKQSQEVGLTVYLDDKEIERQTIVLEPGGSQEVEIVYTPSEAGVLAGRFEITADQFPADDVFRFALQVTPRVRLLLVNGHPAETPRDNAALYLRTAMLATDLPSPWELEEGDATDEVNPLESQQAIAKSLDIMEVPEAGLNAEALSECDLVALANCGALQPPQFQLLCDFVYRGGGLLVLPGDKVNPEAYQQHLFTAPAYPDEQLLPTTLAAAAGDTENAETFRKFGAVDTSHPVLAVFDDSRQRYLGNVTVYRYFPIDPNGAVARLVEFDDGSPAIVESKFGNGRVLCTAFPLHSQWSNIPLEPEFVPLVLRMIAYAKRSSEAAGPAVVSADDVAEFTLDADWAPATGNVEDAAGKSTPISFQRSNSQLKAAFEQTDVSGYFQVEIAGGRAEQPKRATLSFAVNVAAEESNLTTMSESQVKQLFPGEQLTYIDASAQAQQDFGSIGHEREIWRPLILLLFLVIGCEFLLSTLGGQAEERRTMDTVQRVGDLASGRWVDEVTGGELTEDEAVAR